MKIFCFQNLKFFMKIIPHTSYKVQKDSFSSLQQITYGK